MRLLICGDREWTDFSTILATLASMSPYVEAVIQGNCKGADLMAKGAARQLGIPCLSYPAKWKELGNAAGPIRNQQMLDEGKPTHVLAFHNNLGSSKGTKDMIGRAKKAGLPVRLIEVLNGTKARVTDL